MTPRALLTFCLFCTVSALAADDGWRRPDPAGRAWDFPADHHAFRDYRSEWWYLTGHLAPEGADEPRWGFQATFFRVGVDPAARDSVSASWDASDLVLAHAALTDLEAGSHAFSEVLVRAVPPLGGFGAVGDPVLAWCAAPPGTPGRWEIRLVEGGFAVHLRDDRRDLDLDVQLVSPGPPVLHGPGGYSAKSADGSEASLYYSYPRLTVTGVVTDAAVDGEAWFDREIFTGTLTGGRTGWDWLSLRLDDGRNLMAFELRREDGSVDFGKGTLVEADGTLRFLDADDWRWEGVGNWRSPDTGAVYPSGWRFSVPDAGLDLELGVPVPGCENPGIRTYWEGPVTVSGSASGLGYVEMTGYSEK